MKRTRLLHSLLFTLVFCFSIEAQQLISSSEIGSRSKAAITATYNVDAQYGVKLYKILYQTPDLQGVPDTASGLLVVPDVPSNVYPLLCYQHGTVDGPMDVPSNLEGGSALAIVFASMGYVTSAADYLGLGTSRGIHPYVHADSEASAAIDMLFAVRDFAGQNEINLNDQLFVTGYSQGGHAAMAAHRDLETNYSDQFTVTATAPMSGPYSISEKMAEFTLGDTEYSFVAYLAYTALSYNAAYGTLYESLDEFFKPQFVEYIEGFVDEQYGLFTLNFLLIGEINEFGQGTIPKLMLQDSVLEIIQTNVDHPINTALADNDVFDWTPNAPTRLYYCEADDQVFYQNSILADQVMNANGASDLQAISVGPTLDHGGCVSPAVASAIDFFAGFQEVTTSVSVLEDADSVFDLQPNPAGDELFIQLMDTDIRDYELRLMDTNGRVILQKNINGQDRTQLDVSALGAGIYLMNIITDKGSATRKLMIR